MRFVVRGWQTSGRGMGVKKGFPAGRGMVESRYRSLRNYAIIAPSLFSKAVGEAIYQ